MRMLRPLCAPWACASGTDAHPEHTNQFLTRMLSMRISFPIFQMFILYTLNMRVRKWCVHWAWAWASGTDACIENSRQELMHTLSIRVRNWCVFWACASGTNACTEHRNWCVPWAYASVSYAQHSIKIPNLKRSLQSMLSISQNNAINFANWKN